MLLDSLGKMALVALVATVGATMILRVFPRSISAAGLRRWIGVGPIGESSTPDHLLVAAYQRMQRKSGVRVLLERFLGCFALLASLTWPELLLPAEVPVTIRLATRILAASVVVFAGYWYQHRRERPAFRRALDEVRAELMPTAR